MITIFLSLASIITGILIVAYTYRTYQHAFVLRQQEQRRRILWAAYEPLIQEAIFNGEPGKWQEIWKEFDRNAKYDGNEKTVPPHGQFAVLKETPTNVSHRLHDSADGRA